MKQNSLKHSLLSSAVCLALGYSLAPVTAFAEVVTVRFGPDTTTPIDIADPRANDALLTMMQPGALPTSSPLANTSYPYYDDPTWRYGFRTQIAGTITIDTDTKAGIGTIMPFDFLNSGPAIIHDVVLSDGGNDPNTGDPLVIMNAQVDWGGNNNISLDLVLDISGLMNAVNGGVSNGKVITGGVLGASEFARKSLIPMGPAPIATTTWNVSSTGGLPLTDDASPGSPMRDGPFPGFNFNIDARRLVVGDIADILNIVVRSPDGTIQECSGFSGRLVPLTASITSSETDPVRNILWSLDGTEVASGDTVAIQIPTGSHVIRAIVSTESGNTASDEQSIIIRDTTRPIITAAFVDSRTGNEVSSIGAKDSVIIKMEATDICDPSPTIDATAGFKVQPGDIIKAKKSREIHENEHGKEIPEAEVPTVSAVAFTGNPDEVTISIVAKDVSGNTALGKKTLSIIGN